MANKEKYSGLAQWINRAAGRDQFDRLASEVIVKLIPSLNVSGQSTASGQHSIANAIPPSVNRTADQATSPGGETTSAMNQLSRQIAGLTSVARLQAEKTEANTRAVIENSLATVSGSHSSTANTIGKSIFSFLGKGLGLVQLIGKLFERHKEKAVPVVTPYALPSPVQLEAGLVPLGQGGFQAIRYGQDGLPRTTRPATVPQAAAVTVQVQAMDSRSFLDHSEEIANAVKQALLNSHSLNDVVMEI